jgi:hypothetical protein
VIEVADGYMPTGELLFVTPLRMPAPGQFFSDGVTIADESGALVWQHSTPGRIATSLRVDRYRGRPVLSWWEGDMTAGIGDGEFVLADRTYHDVARIRAVGYRTDLHELLITPDDTAVLFCRRDVEVEGRAVLDMLIQEVDIATGRLRWEWDAIEHVELDEAYLPPRDGELYDFFHANSIDIDEDGGLLVSARHTSTIYKIARPSGEVVWRLGGKRSDFAMGEGATFVAQHDARRQPGGRLSLFDNAAFSEQTANGALSRGLVLSLDEQAMTATVDREYLGDPAVLATSQGNMTWTDDGRAFIGWGSQPLITGHGQDGAVSYQAAFPPTYNTYRAFRQPWTGQPTDQPALAVAPGANGAPTAFASWNGATRVARWELLGGELTRQLEPIGRAERTGFETAIEITGSPAIVAVRALAGNGRRLGASRPLTVPVA